MNATRQRPEKERWELDWQRTHWIPLFREPRNRQQVAAYWRKYRGLDEFKALAGLNENSRLLDVGCGVSTVLHFLSGERIGVDPLANAYAELYDYPAGITLHEAPGEALPFEEGGFDAVFCSNCLDHTTEPPRVVTECIRVLRPGGWLLLTCELFDAPRHRNAGHPYALSEADIVAMCRSVSIVVHRRVPWIGLRRYVLGYGPTGNDELILMARKPL